MDKSERLKLVYFHKYIEIPFEKLYYLLIKAFTYSPFNFLGRYRSNGTIRGQASFIVLDVDITNQSIYERHDELIAENLIHFIATTSDLTNIFKYRILLPIDKPVTPNEYKRLIYGIHKSGLISDMDVSASAKPAGFMFSYEGSIVLSYLDPPGQALSVEAYILDEALKPSIITDGHIDDHMFELEFRQFASAIPGNRTKRLMKAAFIMKEEYGLSPGQICHGLSMINSWLLAPKPMKEIKRRICDFVNST